LVNVNVALPHTAHENIGYIPRVYLEQNVQYLLNFGLSSPHVTLELQLVTLEFLVWQAAKQSIIVNRLKNQ